MSENVSARRLIAGSAIIGSIGTFGLHVLLPALPAIADAMQVGAATAQLLVSLALVAIALGNLAVAPLSDRYGRRPVVLASLGLFLAGSVAGAAAPSMELLVAARVLQAFGGGAAMAVIRASIADYFGPSRAAGAIAAVATAILVVPMVAPMLGGFAIEWLGWRAAFGLAALVAAAVLVFALRRLGETKPADPAAGPSPRILSSFRLLLGHRPFLLYVGYNASMMGTIYTFVTGAPYVAAGVLGVSPAGLGLLLFLPAAASFAGFLTASRQANRVPVLKLLRVGALIGLAGSAALTAAAAAGLAHPLAYFLPAMLIGFANAVAGPSAMIGAITSYPAVAGAASGLAGFLQLLVAAAAAQLVAALTRGTALPFALTILGMSLAALVALRAIARSAQAGRRSPAGSAEPTR